MPERNWSQIGSVTVRDYNGNIEWFYSLKSALIWVGERNVAALKYGWMRRWEGLWNGQVTYNVDGDHYEFRDECGLLIPLWRIKQEAEWITQREWHPRYYRWWSRKRFVFRQGPVEGIRCWRGGRVGWMRWPKTTQEIRVNS